MIPGDGAVQAFIVPGYATRALTKAEESRLINRFVKQDYGVASMSELAANAEALKRGGELVGRYLFKGHEWVLWAKVPDYSPGLLLHAKEYRDGWHLGRDHMKLAPDHPTERLNATEPDDGAKITIFARD